MEKNDKAGSDREIKNEAKAPPPNNRPTEAKPLNRLHKTMKIALIISMVIDSLSTFVITAASFLPPIDAITENTPLHIILVHIAVSTLSFCQIGLVLVIGFSLIQWMYRCYRNLELIDQKGLTTTSNWTIICWFIPLLNWVRPFFIMKEIYFGTASDGRSLNMAQKAPFYISLWWTCWVTQGIMGRTSQIILNRDPSNILINVLSIGSNLFEIGAAVFLLRVIKEITELQNHRIPSIQSV